MRATDFRIVLLALLGGLALGCNPPGPGPAPAPSQAPRPGEGPGHRAQALALTPYQELNLGEQAYQEVLKKSHPVSRGPGVEKVREIGQKIARAAEIEPLQREINLRMKGYTFKWEFNLLDDKEVNAFCLPGGKVAVFTGLLPVVQGNDEQINDSMLATVMSHEIAHALAHHSSERLARQQKYQQATESINGALGRLGQGDKHQIIGLLGAVIHTGTEVRGLAYERQQESEADHIGLFLMTFAGYDPRQAIPFWERMEKISKQHGRPPEILSGHPSDARRVAQIREWTPFALRAFQAYKSGRVVKSKD